MATTVTGTNTYMNNKTTPRRYRATMATKPSTNRVKNTNDAAWFPPTNPLNVVK